MKPQERIKADAEAATNDHAVVLREKDMEYAPMIMRLFGYKEGYIAGATAEHDRAQGKLKEAQDAARMFCNKHNETATQLAELVDKVQVLVDALEEIIKMSNAGKTLSHIDSHVAAKARKTLEQWKSGKEVERPCPHCGKELSRDRNLCCRECGKEVSDENSH